MKRDVKWKFMKSSIYVKQWCGLHKLQKPITLFITKANV